MKHVEALSVFYHDQLVGKLAKYEGMLWFQYDAAWLKHGFDLSPQTLLFDQKPQQAKSQIFDGLPGVFYDSLPDGWGLLLMDRFFEQHFNCPRHAIEPLDRLAYMGNRAMGALSYQPIVEHGYESERLNLQKLFHASQNILNDKTDKLLEQLQMDGGSPGGARPKILVGLSGDHEECISSFQNLPKGFEHWIVKFRGKNEPEDSGRIEQAYAMMARLANIDLPKTCLLKEEFFAVKRFDRTGDVRHHVLSLGAYLYADYRLPSLDYAALLGATAVITKNIKEIEKAFRLMVFNIATHNKDDHAKNFSFLHDGKSWRLSPAYDLTWNKGINNQHNTSVAGSGEPRRKDIQSIAEDFEISHWENIIEEIVDATSQWSTIAKSVGVNASQIRTIEKEFSIIRKQLLK